MLKVANMRRDIRAKYENMVFASFLISSAPGDWQNLIHGRLLDEIEDINSRECRVQLPNGQQIIYKVKLILVVADGAERPKITNTNLATQQFA